MDPRLLQYYETELGFVKQMAGEFALEYPKIAQRLGLDGFEVADPYVERLLEGFAFLTARIQLKLDAGFPRFTEHLLDCVLPNYLAPMPSLATVRFWPNANDPTLVQGPQLPRGTALRSHVGKGDQTACEFRTAHAVRLWPVECKDARLVPTARDLATLHLPPLEGSVPTPRSGIALVLTTVGKAEWSKLRIDSLPLYLDGSDEAPLVLLEHLLAHTIAVVVRPVGERPAWQHVLTDRPVRPLGFTDDMALLPVEPRSFQGYRLLREYFTYPQRFRYAELRGLECAADRAGTARELEVVFLFDREEPRLVGNVDGRRFVPFCTPAVNLFPKTCDRIPLDPTEETYVIVPDRTRPLDFEVHSIESVTGHGQGDLEMEFRPLYGTDDFARAGADQRYFTLERRARKLPKSQVPGLRTRYVGTEIHLAIGDGDHAPHDERLRQLSVRALCSNRDLPLSMPIGQATADFTLDAGAFVQGVRCIGRPTSPQPPVAHGETAWRLVDHLTLNWLTLVDEDEHAGATALRELLGLYGNLSELTDRDQIQGVRSIRATPVVRPLSTPGPLAFGRGLEIHLTCEEALFKGSSVYLLGAVLEQFFARYVSVNSFTETVLHTVERGEIARWPPRSGTRPLL